MYSPGIGILSYNEFLLKLNETFQSFGLVRTNKGVKYYNIPAGFDIEVSSFYDNGEKRACMYVWQFGIYNMVVCGRTWSSFVTFIELVRGIMGLSDTCRLCVYVHNLPYEFQFIRKHLDWQEVFLLDDRKPVYANAHGVEFRCSLKLSGGKSLSKIGKELIRYKVEKLVGNLDYSLIRLPTTPLTDEEFAYCENDIRVLLHYIQEKIEHDGDITKIPLTNTGYVREYCRTKCFVRRSDYMELMRSLTLSPVEYSQLKRAFQGGFTHSNSSHTCTILENVASHDFKSSYPAVMLLEKFPMSRSVEVNDELEPKDVMGLLLSKCCMFDLELTNVVPKRTMDYPISKSKCFTAEGVVESNGRVVAARRIETTVTEQDFFVYMQFYECEKIRIYNFRYYEKNYLPKPIAESILQFYEDKTMLDGVKGSEYLYMIAKNMLNSIYGMMVTDIIRKSFKYIDDMYEEQERDRDQLIEKYNSGKRRFLYYPWGVWVTAYARANLFSGILAIGDDYVYSDTDAIKSLNTERHARYFESYNAGILRKIEKSSKHYRIPMDRYSPKGKTIGVWEDEGVYDKFKTLGAKRYLTQKGEDYMLTIAGANKEKGCVYLVSTGKPFEEFTDNLTIPEEFSGRLILTYIDEETSGSIVDYTGRVGEYHELSCIHMEPSSYTLKLSELFRRFLEGEVDISE